MVAASTTAYGGFGAVTMGSSTKNPVQAALTAAVRATGVAEIGIVGFDKRATAEKVRAAMHPLRAVAGAAERAANSIVMVSTEPALERSVGNYGFDPLGLGTDSNFAFMREAELKHARLAMLAAVAWPLQEIFHPLLIDALYTEGVTVPDMLLETNGASPSILNGGLDQPELLPGLVGALLIGSIAEEASGKLSERLQPGDLSLDPLNCYRPLPAAEQMAMRERELANGRLAMLAVLSYVLTEAIVQVPVVRFTPQLFEPLILVPWFRAIMDGAFSIASMDGAVDGLAL